MKLLILSLSLFSTVALSEMVPGGSGSPASFPSGFTGVTDGSAPAAGEIGEIISDIGTTVTAASSNNYIEIASITLTPGTWLISAGINTNHGAGSASGVTLIYAGFSDATNSAPNGCLGGGETRGKNSFAIGGGSATLDDLDNWSFSYPNDIVTVSTNTTCFLNGRYSYSSGTPTWDGYMSAVRIR